MPEVDFVTVCSSATCKVVTSTSDSIKNWDTSGNPLQAGALRFESAEVVLINVEFTGGGGPTVNKDHIAGFDPPRGPVDENSIAARRQAAGAPMRRQVSKPGEGRVIRHSGAPRPRGGN